MSPKHSPPSLLHRVASVDTHISQSLYQTSKSLLPRFLLKSLEISGDGFLFFPILLSTLLARSINPTRSSPTRPDPILINLLIGGVLDLLCVGLLKHLFRRRRPLYNANMSVAFAVDHFSFPSGHSSRVVFIATILHLQKEGLLFVAEGNLGGWVWAWAGLTSVSRVLLGRHFVFDVVAGMVLGVINGLFVHRVLNFENLVWFFET